VSIARKDEGLRDALTDPPAFPPSLPPGKERKSDQTDEEEEEQKEDEDEEEKVGFEPKEGGKACFPGLQWIHREDGEERETCRLY